MSFRPRTPAVFAEVRRAAPSQLPLIDTASVLNALLGPDFTLGWRSKRVAEQGLTPRTRGT